MMIFTGILAVTAIAELPISGRELGTYLLFNGLTVKKKVVIIFLAPAPAR